MTTAAGAAYSLGLPGGHPVDALPVGDEWTAIFERAVDERAVPILACAVDAELVSATTAQHEQLRAAHEAAMRSCVLLERWTLEVARVFRTAGIDFRLLKGPAVAHLDYPDPSWRAFGDIDVLVPSTQYDDAIRALVGVGGRRRSEEVRPGFDRRFGKGVCVILANGLQVDVHRTLASGPFGLTVELDELFQDFDTLNLGDQTISVLPREYRLAHACYHAALGDPTPRIVALRDIAQMLLTTDVDFDQVRRIGRRWRAEIVLARAVSLAWNTLDLTETPESKWAAEYSGDRFERRALDAYTGPERSYARQMLAGLPAVSGLPAKVAYVRSLVFVDPAYAARHGGGFGRRVQRAWSARARREPAA